MSIPELDEAFKRIEFDRETPFNSSIREIVLMASIAISMKRIADALEKRPAPQLSADDIYNMTTRSHK